MISWTRSSAAAERFLRIGHPTAAARSIQSGYSNCRTLATTAAPVRRAQPSTAHPLRTRNTLFPLQTTAPHSRALLSATFSTCNNRLFNESSSASDFPKPDSALLKMVGVLCPGCGSPFQVEHPQDPGYLTRVFAAPDGSEPTPKKESLPKKKGKSAFDPNAKSMSHAQYEEHLKTLDPKILEEMGVSVPEDSPSTNSADGTTGQQTRSGTGAVAEGVKEGEAPPFLEKKPVLQPVAPGRVVCHRCHSLQHHASPLANSSVLPSVLFPSPPAPVPKHIETLARSKTATVVLVVDLIDFPLSLPQPIIDELLKVKRLRKNPQDSSSVKDLYPVTPIILVGNKFDVMPLGTQKHTVIRMMKDYLEKHGLQENVRAIHLVSAKNPSGDEIRLLLKSIGASWLKSHKGNVVMVGAENVGKSQLLNAFLRESGRWRPNNQQVQKQKHGAEQLERQKKLNQLLGESAEWSAMTGKDSVGADIDEYEELYKDRGSEKLKKYQTTVSNVPGTTLGRIKVPLSALSRFLDGSYKDVSGKWLMDTPGIRGSKGDLTSWLTLDELKVTLPKKMLKPASFTLEEGKSFFLGGLVRIDCVSIGKIPDQGTAVSNPQHESFDSTDSTPSSEVARRERGSNPAPKITVFTALPLHKTSTANADKFLETMSRGELTILQPPFGPPERLAAFPGLKRVSDKDIVIVNDPYATGASHTNTRTSFSSSSARVDPFAKLDGRSDGNRSKGRDFDTSATDMMTRRQRENATMQLAGQYGICDLVFSGIGWVMVSGKFCGEQQAVTLRVWTPKGQGAMVRDICLFPEMAANPVDKTAGGIRQRHKIFQPLAIPTASTSEAIEVEVDELAPPLRSEEEEKR
ncbi:hypothetical protein EDD21DRAFT_385547 [Dissophora ornata]|nr:hypothetical protein BGZ58_007919 [Dissophora ornata]KAI8597395.1 hypothetical protein EDD21DRAFT_385547 [Dissophora ornata]